MIKKIEIDAVKVFQKSLLLLVFFTLPACDLYEESWVTRERVQVKEERFYDAVPLKEFSENSIASISRHYAKAGDGPVNVTVTYDPKSRDFTAMKATNEVVRISESFRKNGLKDAKVGLMPVHESPEMVLVSFDFYSAHAPESCDTMPGFKTKEDVGSNPDYALGCTIETLMARQARPKDLKGNSETTPTVDGRRLANSVVDYRDGVPNEDLGGESASGDQ